MSCQAHGTDMADTSPRIGNYHALVDRSHDGISAHAHIESKHIHKSDSANLTNLDRSHSEYVNVCPQRSGNTLHDHVPVMDKITPRSRISAGDPRSSSHLNNPWEWTVFAAGLRWSIS